MDKEYTHQYYKQRQGEVFSLLLDEANSVETVLEEVKDSVPSGPFESFSIQFRTPVDLSLPQGTYQLTDAEQHSFVLLLVPIQGDADYNYYESVFNVAAA